MTLKQRILQKIRSLDSPGILRELEQWLKDRIQQEGELTGAQEESETYIVDDTQGKSSDIKKTSTVTIRVTDPGKTDLIIKLAEQLGLPYYIDSLESTAETESGALEWLKKIAEQGGVEGIDDPVVWQKKERRDRTLPT